MQSCQNNISARDRYYRCCYYFAFLLISAIAAPPTGRACCDRLVLRQRLGRTFSASLIYAERGPAKRQMFWHRRPIWKELYPFETHNNHWGDPLSFLERLGCTEDGKAHRPIIASWKLFIERDLIFRKNISSELYIRQYMPRRDGGTVARTSCHLANRR